MDEGVVVLIQLLVWAAFGVACGFVARARGRSGVGWFFIGLIGGCFALVILFVIPDLNQERAQKEAEEKRRQRLEEELMHERSKNHAFRSHATGRLDQHDSALGLDTRAAAPGLKAPPPPPRIAGTAASQQHGWYRLNERHESEGPFDLAQMREALAAGSLQKETLVWHETMADWAPLQAAPLARLLA